MDDYHKQVITDRADVNKAVFTVVLALIRDGQHLARSGKNLLCLVEAKAVLFRLTLSFLSFWSKRSVNPTPIPTG
jgi:hypothetical protein